MYSYAALRILHLELTQLCNAACPQCSRFTVNGALKPNLPKAELSLQDLQRILPIELLAQLSFVYLCGNYGDPIVAKDTIPILQYFRNANSILQTRIHTNGSARGTDWWRELARLSSSCVFGIDGLKDTNHLYRVGTNWDRIMANVAAYIEAGGEADWQFLVFKHNEHQVEEARRLSKSMGFRRFFVKATTRFYKSELGREVPSSVLRPNSNPGYTLEPTARLELRNPRVVQLESETSSASSYRRYLLDTKVTCKAAEENSFYISAEGFVLPCCWMSIIYEEGKTRDDSEIGRILSALPDGFASIDGKQRSVQEIINGDLFQKIIPSLWAPDSNRLIVCARKCGTCDVQSGQYVSLS